MPRPGRLRGGFRLPRRTLRVRLALLYAALFCVSAVALAAVAVIFRPDFLAGSGSSAAARPPGQLPHCCRQGQSIAAITGTVAHDMSQNPAGAAMVAVMAVLAVGVGWLVAGRLVRPLRAITASARDISASNLHRRLGLRGRCPRRGPYRPRPAARRPRHRSHLSLTSAAGSLAADPCSYQTERLGVNESHGVDDGRRRRSRVCAVG